MTPLLRAVKRFRDATIDLTRPIGDAEFALNPLDYAWDAHAEYVRRYAPQRAQAVWLGMNPGPWGMAQTGVPFGSIPMVKEFLGIERSIGPAPQSHPKRPIEGFSCARVEVSGSRLWGTIQQECGTPQRFFSRYFVLNYCPVVWQTNTGANLPPNKLPSALTRELFDVCDAHLAEVLQILDPAMVIGVGAWAEAKARAVVKRYDLSISTGRVLHPSPASPLANRGWSAAAVKQLEALGHPLGGA